MPKFSKKNSVDRIIDANLNRLKEGLRVIEELSRFILENKKLNEEIKSLRHKVETVVSKGFDRARLLAQRNSPGDIGRLIAGNELKRANSADIFFSNIQRIKESLRVLEEFSKLRKVSAALEFKKLRYRVYEIEKQFFLKAKQLGKVK
ncbi:MAG: thiamine-phosphate pyrophosphorylase [Candidatus Omnitrophica bacterium]|nr:thiamine-phosphate pyrophosphorylase [Candidatus Omnitrophota bacterium]